MNTIIKMRTFFESFKNLTFWQRLFSWRTIVALSYEAWEELIQQSEYLRSIEIERTSLQSDKQVLQSEKVSLSEQLDSAEMNVLKSEGRIVRMEEFLKERDLELRAKEKSLQIFEQIEAERTKQHDHRMSQALAIQASFENEKQRLSNERVEEVQQREEKQRETWRDHEAAVATFMRRLSDQHAIEYVTEFSFRGKPDNAIKICDEIIVFDAKSPAGESLTNFNGYIKGQAEAAKKYAEHESVRKDVYLVIPSNTNEVITKWSYDMGTYRVFVVTLDALEPVMLSLKQLETYDFAEQLSPEDRQSICRVIGSLLYASKRRIQVDQFFNSHLLELISKVQREIPDAMQEEISKNEKAMKLNPSIDKRSKEIGLETLRKAHGQLEGQANSFNVATPYMIDVIETQAN